MTSLNTLQEWLSLAAIRSPAWWSLTSSNRCWVFGGTATVALLLLVGVGLAHWQSVETTSTIHALAAARNDQLEETQRAAERTHARSAEPQPWWSKLPVAAADHTASEQLSADALALAPKLNVQVQRLTFAPPSHVTGAPYRSTTVQIEARGPYADIKRWLGELLARRPQTLAVKSTDWRRGSADAAAGATAPNTIEASIELQLFEPAVARQKRH